MDKLVETIQQSTWESTPNNHKKTSNYPIYPVEVRDLIGRKRKARKRWQNSRAPEDKTLLNKLCNDLKSLIKKIKNESINNFLQGLSAEKDRILPLESDQKVKKAHNANTAN